jgi:hypothetical protein
VGDPHVRPLALCVQSDAHELQGGLARGSGLGRLATIDLRRNHIGAAGAIALLEAEPLFWSRVDVRDNPLGPGVLAVDDRRPFPSRRSHMTRYGR